MSGDDRDETTETRLSDLCNHGSRQARRVLHSPALTRMLLDLEASIQRNRIKRRGEVAS